MNLYTTKIWNYLRINSHLLISHCLQKRKQTAQNGSHQRPKTLHWANNILEQHQFLYWMVCLSLIIHKTYQWVHLLARTVKYWCKHLIIVYCLPTMSQVIKASNVIFLCRVKMRRAMLRIRLGCICESFFRVMINYWTDQWVNSKT